MNPRSTNTDPTPAEGVERPVPDDADTLFSTADVRSDLKKRSVRSGLINLGSQGMQVVLSVGGTMVLARLLRPADFGLYAMVGTLIAFVGSFREFGLPMAAVHRESLSHREYSALFWIYLKLNLVIALAMVAMAPALSWFYGQPELTAITVAMAGGVFILGLSMQQEALLKRQMRFPALTALNVGATIIGVAAGIGSALLGAGYWALVIQFGAMCASKSAGAWLVSRWRPSRVHPGDTDAAPGLRRLLTYGADVTAAGIVKHIGRNLDRVLIGYLAGPQALGFYHHADKWAHFPVRQLYVPLRSVAVSGLSRVQNEPSVYRAYVRRGFLPVFAVTMPSIAFLFAEADRVIGVLLGPQWLEAVPLFRILCVAAFIGKVSTVTRWLYLSSGETRRLLKWDLIATPVMIATVAIGAIWGVRGVAMGFTAGTAVLVYPTVWYCLRRSHLRMRDFRRIVWRPASAAIGAAAAVLALQGAGVAPSPALLALVVHGAIFVAVYAAFWLLLPGGLKAARDMMDMAQELPWKRAAPSPESAASGEGPGSPLGP